MNIIFTITFDYKRFYTESELSVPGSQLRTRVAAARAIEGAILLITENQPTIEIVDELLPWIQNLCFRAISQLIIDGEVRIQYFSRSGFIDLKLAGDVIEVKGNKTASAVFPKGEFLPALLACGERFDSLMREIKGNDPDVIGNLDYMKHFAEMARKEMK